MPRMFLETSYRYAISILPWLIIGIVLAYFLEKKINRKTIINHFRSINLRTLFITQLIGMISPLSIMSFLPIANELEGMGFNPGLLLSFFIAERAYDLQSFFIISGLFGVWYALLNGMAIFTSLLATALFLRKEFFHFSVKDKVAQQGFWRRQIRLLLLVVIGIIAGALVRTLVPERLFRSYAGNSLQGFWLALLIGFLIYFGPILGNYPVAKSFSDLGMSQLGTFTFLTVSPILNLVVILLFSATVGLRKTLKAFLIYSLAAIVMSILFSFLI